MEFQNEFDVKAPIDEVYSAMLDLERVAPAMPGAEVLDKVGEGHYKVAIKVKVGPISMQYRGDIEIVEQDAETHSAKLKVQAREARGQGTANADVDMSLTEDGAATHGQIQANVQLAGRAAAMGRGVIQDVSAKLVTQFANNLAGMLETRPAPEAEPGDATPDDAPAPEPSPAATPAGDEGVDALGIAASVAADRFRDPRVLFGSFGLVLLIGWLLGRRSAS